MPRWQPDKWTTVTRERMYVYPPQLLGRKRIRSPLFAATTLTNTPRPRLIPQGDEAALGFSDGTDILPPAANAGI
jgi:hypothetical protein